MSSFNFSYYVHEPTRKSKNTSTLLDVIFCNKTDIISATKAIKCPFSDHQFLLCSLNIKSGKHNHKVVLTRSLNLNTLEKLKLSIKNIPFHTMDSFKSVNLKWYFFKKVIMDVLNEIAPFKKKQCAFY
jgi:hypothetical protein